MPHAVREIHDHLRLVLEQHHGDARVGHLEHQTIDLDRFLGLESRDWLAADGIQQALVPRASLAAETSLPQDPPSATEVLLAHNVDSREEVEAVLAQAAAAGARIVKPAHALSWGGHGGCFEDPDGHLREVVHNPGFNPA